jgi:hypothetical protein
MKSSESIANLASAFVKAQAEMSGAKKSAKNPFFKSSYANLEEIIYCVREPFATHGLGFIQFPIAGEGSAGVETIILHESGEWISGDFSAGLRQIRSTGNGQRNYLRSPLWAAISRRYSI